MKNKLLFLFIILLQTSTKAQERFNITIHFPSELQLSQIKIYYNNGIEDKTIKTSSSIMNITDFYYSKYAIIRVKIDKSDMILPSNHIFYLSKKLATITYKKQNLSSESELAYKLVNAYDANIIDKKFEQFTKKEIDDINKFNQEENGLDATTSFNKNEQLRKKLIKKQLDFLNVNQNEYYCFQVFKNHIAPNIFSNADSLYFSYRKMFPNDFLNTIEGKKIEEILLGRRIAINENIKAIDFCTSDIYDNKICLENLKGKYVLINFWASWCGPCVAELPSIKEISEQYSNDSLEIISVNIDNDSSKFIKASEQNKMNWINIYRDFSLGTKFGGLAMIPTLFLIDKSGTIIYNRNYRKDITAELPILKSVLKEKISIDNYNSKKIYDNISIKTEQR